MKTPANLGGFTVGASLAFLLCSVTLNIFFYTGKISALHTVYCDGYLDGAQNVVKGSK